MKLSFSTLSCPDWSWEKVIEEAVKNGYQGIEIRGIEGEMFLPNAEPFSDENIDITIETLKNQELKITDLGSSVSFHDPSRYAEFITEGKAYIDLAKRLGVDYIRIFGDKIPEPTKRDETINLITKGINELCCYASDKAVMCLLETHGNFANLTSLMPIINGVNSPQFGIIWDIAHTYKDYGDDVSEFLEVTWPMIKHVHIKDLIKEKDTYHLCMIGEGSIPIGNIIDDLRDRGYKGYLSLEWEKKWHPELADPEIVIPYYANYMRQLINKPSTKFGA